jgi:hypothetical protein
MLLFLGWKCQGSGNRHHWKQISNGSHNILLFKQHLLRMAPFSKAEMSAQQVVVRDPMCGVQEYIPGQCTMNVGCGFHERMNTFWGKKNKQRREKRNPECPGNSLEGAC